MTRSKWQDWQPKGQKFSDLAGSEPTKPTKPSFDGFVGSIQGDFQKIEVPEPTQDKPTVIASKPAEVVSKAVGPAVGQPAPGAEARTAEPRLKAPAPAAGYSVIPRDGCPACGHQSFRLESNLWACAACAPEGAEIVRTEELQFVVQSAAVGLLNECGTRIMETATGPELGVWRDLDSRELRHAIEVLGLDRLPVRYLDDPAVPEKYRQRRSKPPKGIKFLEEQQWRPI